MVKKVLDFIVLYPYSLLIFLHKDSMVLRTHFVVLKHENVTNFSFVSKKRPLSSYFSTENLQARSKHTTSNFMTSVIFGF